MKFFTPRTLLVLLILAVAAGWYGYRVVFGGSVQTPEGDPYPFYVRTGADYATVADKLLREKLISDPQSFHWVARFMKYPYSVKPGRYLLKDGMSNRELISLLRSGAQTPLKFTFVKFRTIEQFAEHVGKELEMSAADFLKLLNDREFLAKHRGLKPETVLGIFIPNTYEVWWTESPEDFFERMFREYDRFWTDARNDKRQQWGLNRLEVMILASIVEEETNRNDEKADVAGVYLNRIRKGWPLEADPTVKFAVGDFSLRRILHKHLQVDSPYNTYLYSGLPPGPICTPSIPSIDGVLNGNRHDYMFFCAKIDGSGYHHFSKTLAEHEAYARQYREMLNRQGIR